VSTYPPTFCIETTEYDRRIVLTCLTCGVHHAFPEGLVMYEAIELEIGIHTDMHFSEGL
jgi:hypothetical protein